MEEGKDIKEEEKGETQKEDTKEKGEKERFCDLKRRARTKFNK